MARTNCWALLSGEQLLAASDAEAIRFAGQPVGHLRPDARRQLGLASSPAERLGHGAVPELSLTDNALLTAFQHGLVSHGLIQRGKVEVLAKTIIQRFGVQDTGCSDRQRAACPAATCRNSILGREILQNPELLVAAHPTWGVDVGRRRDDPPGADRPARCRARRSW